MKLSFIWNFDKANKIYDCWRDGLRAAIEEIGKEHEVDIYLGDEYKNYEDNSDAILLWSDSNDPIIDWAQDKKGKKGIILTTDPHNIENLRKLDVVFCESTPVYEAVRRSGIHAVRAFGTDTDFYSPDESIKDIEYFYPATFSPWKLQRDIAYLRDKLWLVGTLQPDGMEDYNACLEAGCHISIGYYKAEHIRDLYRRAKNVIIPAIHGSERTVLEAMSSNILPQVLNEQNIRIKSYIEEYEKSGLTPREFVVTYYSARQYADKILKGFHG